MNKQEKEYTHIHMRKDTIILMKQRIEKMGMKISYDALINYLLIDQNKINK